MPRTKQPKTKKPVGGLTANQKRDAAKMLATLSSELVSRNRIAYGLGTSYSGDRDVYAALGYPKAITYQLYENKFKRQDIAKQIVTAYPDACWRGKLEIVDDEDPAVTTDMEKGWQEVLDDINVFHFFSRVDKLAGIGKYAVLFMGFDDVSVTKDFSEPLGTTGTVTKLLYLQPYSEQNAIIETWVTDAKDPRYGLPLMYKLQVSAINGSNASTTTSGIAPDNGSLLVHYTRVVHVAKELLESNVYGTPALECVYNRLDNIEIIIGGTAEGTWRAGFPGMALEMDGTAQIEDEEALEDEIDEYVNNYRRVMRLKGMKANMLVPNVPDPSNNLDSQLKLIAGATRIPVRILTGSERGELASTQDKDNWNDRVDEKRKDFCEAVIVRPFIDTLIEVGILGEPVDNDYVIEWPDLDAVSDKDKALVSETRAKAIKAYVESGSEVLIPPMHFLTKILFFTDDEAKEMMDAVTEMIDEGAADEEVLRETIGKMAEEEQRARAEAEALANLPPPTAPPVKQNKVKAKRKSRAKKKVA